jgi:hypothetical protein
MPGRCTTALLLLALAAPAGVLAAGPSCTRALAMNPALKPLVDAAIADLAQRLRIPATEVCVEEARTVVWPDRSLGCPQPGLLYPQVQQDGVFIRLRAQGRSHAYHGGGARTPFLCDSPERRDPPATGGGAGQR